MGGARKDPIRVAIIDDHPVFRLGLKRALEREPGLEVIWELESASNLESAMTKAPVDVLLVDVYLGSSKDGITITREILDRWPNVKVAAMSASIDSNVTAASARAGAGAFLAKSMPVAEMVGLIRRLAAATETTARGRSGKARSSSSTNATGLSPREMQVLGYLRVGRTNREIASRLGVSVATVNKHVHEILTTLRVRNRTEAVAAVERMSV